MVLKIVGLFLTLTLASCSRSVDEFSSKDNGGYQSGAKFYEQRCDICHGADGKLGVSSASDLSASVLTTDELKEIIKNGKGAMPAFGHALKSDSTLYALIEHITSLRK